MLSWFYAVCSQITIWLPFNLVPISLQPLPIFLLSLLIGWPAVTAYFLCLFQASLGVPFFAGFQGGMLKLLGPTGGYIFGWAFAAVFLVLIRNYKKDSFIITFSKLLVATIIFYTFGLLQLSWFVPNEKLFILGVYPFVFGAFLKNIIISYVVSKYKKRF